MNFLKQLAKNIIYYFLISLFSKQKKPQQKSTDIVILLCHRDVSMCIVMFMSLFYYLGYTLPIFIINFYSIYAPSRQEIIIPDNQLVIRKLLYGRFHCAIPEYFSCGFFCLTTPISTTLPRLEKIFRVFFSIGYTNDWLAEETALALLFGSLPSKAFPSHIYQNY